MSASRVPRPKAAVVALRFDGYGGERVARDLTNGLTDHYDVVAVSLEDHPRPVGLLDQVAYLTLSRSASGVRETSRLVRDLRRALVENGVTRVVSVMTYANIVSVAASLGTSRRVVVTEHSIASKAMATERRSRAIRLTAALLYRRAHAVVAVSHAAAADLAGHLRLRRPVEVVYNGVEVRDEPSRDGPVAPGVRRIACVAAMNQAKDHATLLHAVARIPDVELDLVGDGIQRMQVERLADELGLADRVRFHGYRADPWSVIGRVDVCVQPSRWEGFGLAVVEAACRRIPVVVTPVGALPELVPRFAPGSVADATTPDALAAAIRTQLATQVSEEEWVAARDERARHLTNDAAVSSLVRLWESTR